MFGGDYFFLLGLDNLFTLNDYFILGDEKSAFCFSQMLPKFLVAGLKKCQKFASYVLFFIFVFLFLLFMSYDLKYVHYTNDYYY